MINDESFNIHPDLNKAITLLNQQSKPKFEFSKLIPTSGIGELETLDLLAPYVLGEAAHLDDPLAFAHMDPPTPWITWATTMWNARLNQNLLHPATAPFALEAEKIVINWISPYFGMDGGHFCSGSTIANITAIWAAREIKKIRTVVASETAHISIEKAANLLGLEFQKIPTNTRGEIDAHHLDNLENTCLVLTAGTTTVGAIDDLNLIGKAAWTHVDSAWTAPLKLSPTYSPLLEGINKADSVSISGHKWFFQPKDSAMILFKSNDIAEQAIGFGSGYLAKPNIGIQGSRGAAAIPFLATLMAWGVDGFLDRLHRCMTLAHEFYNWLDHDDRIETWGKPITGINVFRPKSKSTQQVYESCPDGMLSTCMLDDELWLRSVAANPLADIKQIIDTLDKVLDE